MQDIRGLQRDYFAQNSTPSFGDNQILGMGSAPAPELYYYLSSLKYQSSPSLAWD